MGEQNPYESPAERSKRMPAVRYEKPRDLWLGILGIISGIVLLLITAYFYFAEGLLVVGALGGGIGIVAVGALRLMGYLDDRRCSALLSDLTGDLGRQWQNKACLQSRASMPERLRIHFQPPVRHNGFRLLGVFGFV